MARLVSMLAFTLTLAGCFTPQWEVKTANGGVISYNPLARKDAAELMTDHCGGRGYEVVATRPYRYSGGVSSPQIDSFRCYDGGH